MNLCHWLFSIAFSRQIMSQLMRLWCLSHRRPAKAEASLRIRAVSPEPSLFAHMNDGGRRRVILKIRHLAPLDGCACVFEEWVYGGHKVPKFHEVAQFIFVVSSIVRRKVYLCPWLLSRLFAIISFSRWFHVVVSSLDRQYAESISMSLTFI